MSAQEKFDWDSIELSDAAIDSVIFLTSVAEDGTSDGNAKQPSDQDACEEDTIELNNISEFLDWYETLEDEPDDASDLQCRHVLEGLRKEKLKWQEVLQDVDKTLDSLGQLRSLYSDVSSKTNALHNDCEHLLDEQDKLLKRAEQIDSYLQHFNQFEQISAKLSSPYLQATAESLLPMLNQIDDCLEFVSRHPDFKEAQTYQVKFKQLLARCLTLIHDSVFSVLDNAVHSLEAQIEQLSPENAFTLFYGRFRSHSAKVRPLMELLEARLQRSDDYRSALDECVSAYTQHRRRLLRPSVEAAVADMATRFSADHCGFVRTGCSFVLHLCEDEESLFLHFFRRLSPLLTEMLRGLCASFYDAFRPCIVHIHHLETLAELCHILQHEAMASFSVREEEPESGAAFSWACGAVLADVQERLVYRTHVYARSEVLGFKPAAGDLAYPEKLEMMRDIAECMKKGEVATGDADAAASKLAEAGLAAPHATGNMPLSPADLHGMWYPTVRRTLTLLSKLSRCLDRGTFQGLSQEILSLCCQSLLSASKRVAARSPSGGGGSGGSSSDSDLFLMKHLLILREQVAPFQLEASVKEASLDFSKMRTAAVSLLSARARLLALNRNNAFLQFLLDSHPDVVESTLDSRQEVDAELRAACQRFIASAVARLAGGVADFNEKCAAFMRDASATSETLRRQSFASPTRLQQLMADAYRRLKDGAPALLHSLRLYLANTDTEHILFRPVKASVVQSFKTADSLLQQHYSEEDRQIINCPTLEQVNLLLNPSRED